MNVKIKITGLTDSTISFSELSLSSGSRLNLRGKDSVIVFIDTVEKANELRVLESCSLIKCTNLSNETRADVPVKIEKSIEPTKIEENAVEPTQIDENAVEPTQIDENAVEPTQIDESVIDVPEAKVVSPRRRRGRGRPSGSKNKRKAIRRVGDNKPDEDDGEDVDASIEAMKELEAEEEKSREVVPEDQSKLAVNEQMGRLATVAIGNNKTVSKEMNRSAVPESKVAEDSDPFIDIDDPSTKEDADIAFIDNYDDNIDDEENFLEV